MARLVPFALVGALALFPSAAYPQWQPNGAPVSIAYSDQTWVVSVSDGAGGVIMAWMDYRNAFISDIYAQRLNAAGVPMWTLDGVPVCTAIDQQYYPQLVSDGAGGAIISWEDRRVDADIYAQRINASGVAQWAANGVAVCVAGSYQLSPMLIADGAGGAIVTWPDFRNTVDYDIYTQRVNAAGVMQWAANGVSLCNAGANQNYPVIVPDNAGGAIVTWEDVRSGNYDIYGQRINAAGAVQWPGNGVGLSVDGTNQRYPVITADGSGGAIVAWTDYRGGPAPDVYAQRVNAAGAVQWPANGVGLTYAAGDQYPSSITTNGAGGAIVAWYDSRNDVADVYVQRVNANGVTQWTYDGVPVCTAANGQYNAKLLPDGAGGVVAAWTDERTVYSDLYAQKVNSAGVVQWTPNGVAMCTTIGYESINGLVADGQGGAIMTWSGAPSSNYDAYAQRFEFQEGQWGHPEPTVTSVADVKGDQGGKVKVNFKASGLDVRNYDTITHYSIWRATDAVSAAAAMAANPALAVPPGRITADFAGPALRVERTPSTSYYWELVGTQSAQFFDGYRFSASTTADSSSQGAANNFFQVLSHTADEFRFWTSNVLSGHSVDNLAPAAPLALTAQRIGNYVYLKWNRAVAPDLRDYSVYRATASGVTPVPLNFLSSAADTILTDTTPPSAATYYIVTAFDVHANQSAPSNEASVQAATGVGNTPPVTHLTVLPNHPNPFQGTTDLQIGLPADSDLSIEVFDVAGRRVRAQVLGNQKAGWRKVPFDGRDGTGRALPSGVYFYKVTAKGTTVTNKMVIAR